MNILKFTVLLLHFAFLTSVIKAEDKMQPVISSLQNFASPAMLIEAVKVLNLTVCIEGFYNANTNLSVRDTVKVYLRDDDSPFLLIDSAQAYLSTSGVGIFTFSNISNDFDFLITVKHRNSLETWSNETRFTNDALSYNFTTSASQAHGNNLKLKGGKYCIYSGDVNQDGIIDGTDVLTVDNDAYSFLTGRRATDLNGDGIVDIADCAIVDNNASLYIFVKRPAYQNINYPEIHTENVTINGFPVDFFHCDNLMSVNVGDTIELDWVSIDIDFDDELYDTVYFSPPFPGTLIFNPPLTHEGHSPLRTHMFLTTNVPYPPIGYFQTFGYARIESYDEADNESRCFLNFTFK